MDKFLSCDWGTSTFRLRLIDAETLKILAEQRNDTGIAKTFKAWQEQGADTETRQAFYYSVITTALQNISKQLHLDLGGIPIIASGMISSSIGMMELPYKEVPAAIDGADLIIKRLLIPESDNELIIISGIKTKEDIIRGEETKVIGCASFFNDDSNERLIVFPGTHPKHVIIQNNKIAGFKTYMTGEFFDLLTTHSILASSVKKNADFDKTSFKAGIENSLTGDLLQTAFGIRTNDILKKVSKEGNYYYLSGLLIGSELKDLQNYKYPVYLCGADLLPYYQYACDILGIKTTLQIDADEALLSGQKQVYSFAS
jgi:2-dehydro-3-deoxygalactonokinase